MNLFVLIGTSNSPPVFQSVWVEVGSLGAGTTVGPVIPQVHPVTCPVPDLADTVVELPSSDKPWCESQAPGQTSARPAHLMDLLRFIALWAHEQRSGCPPVASGIGCSAMVFLNKWLRQGGPVHIPSRYFLPAGTSSFCRARWGWPVSEDGLGCSLSRQWSHIHLDAHSKTHQSGHLFPNPRR